jgi:hypothetical protein
MTEEEHLLACLAEECAEVAHRACKALRFGLDDVQEGHVLTNADRIYLEFHDLLAVMEMLEEAGILSPPLNPEGRIRDKKERVLEYMVYAGQRGTLMGGIPYKTVKGAINASS